MTGLEGRKSGKRGTFQKIRKKEDEKWEHKVKEKNCEEY